MLGLADSGFEVMEGTVIDIESVELVDREGEAFIVTEASMVSDDGRLLTVPSPGGVVEDRAVVVAGAPRFMMGDRLVLVGRIVEERVKFAAWRGSIFIEALDERGEVALLDHVRQPLRAPVEPCGFTDSDGPDAAAALAAALRECLAAPTSTEVR